MKHDGIHLNEATLERLQNRLSGLPQRERQRARMRRLTTGISAAAAAVVLLLWLRPEPTSSTAGPAEEWLQKTTATDLVETLEYDGSWEPNPEELGELLSDEELDQITLFNASKS